jgi:hypothetical protein
MRRRGRRIVWKGHQGRVTDGHGAVDVANVGVGRMDTGGGAGAAQSRARARAWRPEAIAVLAAIRPRAGGGATVRWPWAVIHIVIVRGDGAVVAIGETSPVVGWFEDALFTEAQTQLAPGDLLVMFTDGLLEAIAGHGSTDDDAVRELLGPLAGCTPADVANRLDTELPDGELRLRRGVPGHPRLISCTRADPRLRVHRPLCI